MVRAESREQGQLLRPHEHVDRVDLQKPDLGEHAAHVARERGIDWSTLNGTGRNGRIRLHRTLLERHLRQSRPIWR